MHPLITRTLVEHLEQRLDGSLDRALMVGRQLVDPVPEDLQVWRLLPPGSPVAAGTRCKTVWRGTTEVFTAQADFVTSLAVHCHVDVSGQTPTTTNTTTTDLKEDRGCSTSTTR